MERTPVTHPAFLFEEQSGGIESYRLKSNGLRVLMLPETTAPVVAFMITYHVGSRNEGVGLTGATHFLEHMMFKGTARFHKKQGTSVFNVLQRVGARINATTWFDRTNYYALLPKAHLIKAVEIEADRMRNVLLDPEDLASERTVILNEFDRGENEPIRNLFHAVWSTAFVAHSYHHPTIGWRSDIENVTREGLRHFYDTYYWPDNATLSIIGDFERSATLDLVNQHFGDIPAAPAPVPEVGTREPKQLGERLVTVRKAGQLGALMQGYKSPRAFHPDTDALDVLAMVLGSGKNSRLYRKLTDVGMTAQVGVSVSRLRDPGLFYIYALLNPGHAHETVEEVIESVIQEIQEQGITEAERTRALNQLKAQEAFGRDGAFAVAAQLNEAIAAGDWKLYTTYLDRVQRVSLNDIQQVAQRYLVPRHRTTGRYIPEVANPEVETT